MNDKIIQFSDKTEKRKTQLEEALNMTSAQIFQEIRIMRDFEKFLKNTLGEEKYNEIAKAFGRESASEMLERLGAEKELITEILEQCDKEIQ